eukprot:1369215-Amphidinium_carterae.1
MGNLVHPSSIHCFGSDTVFAAGLRRHCQSQNPALVRRCFYLADFLHSCSCTSMQTSPPLTMHGWLLHWSQVQECLAIIEAPAEHAETSAAKEAPHSYE